MSYKLREPWSGLTHALGAVLCVLGLVFLVSEGMRSGTAYHIVSFSVFGISAILLYTASAVYHLVPGSDRVIAWLRRVDHTMIFVLIAGTYTPFCLVTLRGGWGWSIFGIIWGIAAFGILMKLVFFEKTHRISTYLYVGMGWVVVVAAWPLARALSGVALAWLVAGGLLYTIGAVIFAMEPAGASRRRFGHHEVFHLFVMAGTFAHFWTIYRYVR